MRRAKVYPNTSAFHYRRVLVWIRRLLFGARMVALHQMSRLEIVTTALVAFAVAKGTWPKRTPWISKRGSKRPHRREVTDVALMMRRERVPRRWERVTERRMETKELDFVVAAVQRATVLAVVVVLAAKIAHLHQGHRQRRIKKALAALAVAAIEVRLQYQEHYQITHHPWRVSCLRTSSTAAPAAVAKKTSLQHSKTESVMKTDRRQRDQSRGCFEFVHPHLLQTMILPVSSFQLMASAQINSSLPLEYLHPQRGPHLPLA